MAGGKFFGEYVLRRGRDGIAEQSAVCLHADQRAWLVLRKIIFDDEICAFIEGNQQVIALALGDDAFRTDAGHRVGELVVRAVNRLYVQRAACGVDVVLSEGVAGGIVQGKEDLLRHTGSL